LHIKIGNKSAHGTTGVPTVHSSPFFYRVHTLFFHCTKKVIFSYNSDMRKYLLTIFLVSQSNIWYF
jgi:hypothetical protein